MSATAALHLDASARRARLDPHDRAFVQDPYAAYAVLHLQAPRFFWDEYGFWCVADYDSVNRLLRDRRLGREPPGGGPKPGDRPGLDAFDGFELHSMLQLEPPTHTRLRTLVNRAFVSRQIERLRANAEALAHRLIDALPRGEAFDLLPAFATPTPITLIAELLGVPADMGPQLVSWSNRMVAMYMHAPSDATARDANDATRAFTEFLRGYISERRRAPGDDLLSALIAAQEGGDKLSEGELVSTAILLLNAGHEATVHQIGNAVAAILAQGDNPRRFFATPEATAATVEECLRYAAPLHMFTRYAYEPVEIEPGLTLAPGDEVGLMLAAANNDPAAFAAPRRFDPARGDQKNVSFGAGIHFCVGAPLARLELQEGLRALFGRAPGLRLAEAPVYRDNYHFHGLERLMCRID